MIIETKLRSVLKTLTWRVIATVTTIGLVYLFFGKLETAAAVGGIEVVLKVLFYFLHERAWGRSSIGRKKIDPFVLWFTGLPLSGKTTIADLVHDRLVKKKLEMERLDGRDVRKLFPEIGFSRDERIQHLKRISFLIKMLEKNKISVVASFISPYKESRDQIREMINQGYIEIYVKADIETCRKRDKKGKYLRADKGEIKNFTGVSDVYEEPESPDIILDTDKLSYEECADTVIRYVEKNLIK